MLVSLLIAVIVIGLIYYIITLLPLPQPFKNVAIIILLLICVIWLLGYVGAFPGAYWSHPLR
jgi:hypothetical protein